MTMKLYFEDSSIEMADCKVVQVINNEGKTKLILERTPFYPEGGGQPNDTGTIDDVPVTYVYEEDDNIVHVLETTTTTTPDFKIGQIVSCKINKQRRLDLTQQHSGEHLLSGALYKLFGAVNAGFHLGDDYVTIDMDCKGLTAEMIQEAECFTNEVIQQNKPIVTCFVDKEQALALPLRKELKAEGLIRIVEMAEGADCCACCGTHVKNTGEIGLVKVVKQESYKGLTRIYFKCGNRALNDYHFKHDRMVELSRMFSAEPSEIVQKIKSQQELVTDLKLKLSKLSTQLAEIEAKELINTAVADFVYKEYQDEDFDYLEKVYEQLKDQNVTILLLSQKDKRLMLGCNKAEGIDCGKLFKETVKEYGGRGGGNAKRAQAGFESLEKMHAYAEYLQTLTL